VIGSRERRAKNRREYVRASWYAGHQITRMATRMLNFGQCVKWNAEYLGIATDLSLIRHGVVRLGHWAW